MSDSSPAPRNKQAVQILNTPGLYFISAPDHPVTKLLNIAGIQPTAFVFVMGGKMFDCIIGPERKLETISADFQLKGPFLP